MMIAVGMTASRSKTITDDDIRTFARVSGDHNPVHLDDDYAATTQFGRRIAHGLLTASLISTTLADDLPGPGTVYLSQALNFKAPVFIGDEITATVEVIQYRERSRVTTLHTTCTNQEGMLVLDGEAVVLAPEA